MTRETWKRARQSFDRAYEEFRNTCCGPGRRTPQGRPRNEQANNKFGFAPLISREEAAQARRATSARWAPPCARPPRASPEATEAKIEQRRRNAEDAKAWRAAQEAGRVLQRSRARRDPHRRPAARPDGARRGGGVRRDGGAQGLDPRARPEGADRGLVRRRRLSAQEGLAAADRAAAASGRDGRGAVRHRGRARVAGREGPARRAISTWSRRTSSART